ncbi:DegV family protein [Lachnospiraceae bacterium MD1]|jgi:DegV family protein with EDD domain|uniref:DegV family protein n=1 Tax=Variimorphobacter saccharofermentans TaxID=2755051 RepID=A0A839K1I7_9FIRM|nr:DegV family protein [Variimorphobacter saccharofermentans]MBB2183773.1 DegV family protein [Variimorphobacter saccharofermentans]
MKDFQIYSDSSCDLPECLVKEHNIRLIPFYVSFDHDNYYKENIDITKEAFYDTLVSKHVYSTTSLPTVQDYINEFKPALKEGKDIICLCLTQKFSGSYQSAVNAKHILEEQFPESNIQIIDSIQATAGQGLLLLQIAYMKEAGYSIDLIIEKLNILKPTSRIMFTVDTLNYLSKGRRIGKAVSLTSDMLDLKPLIQLKDAELIPYSNVRGRKKSLDKVFSMVEEYFTETGEKPEDYDFCIANATTNEDAIYLQNKVEEYIGRKITYPVFQIGVTIGTNTGPGGIGICFVKKYNCI